MSPIGKSPGENHPPGAKNQLVKILAPDRVQDDTAVLEQYARDYSWGPVRAPALAVQPRVTDEVKALVEWAKRTLTPLIPVSSGPPHFRGDTVPEQGGVIMDLSGMNKILRLDRRNRVALIEPGVTFTELKPAVEKQGLRLMLPLAPRPNKSIIGSYLEREPILVPKYHWDMSDPLGCTEVIFGTGDLFRTGTAAGPGTLDEQWAAGQAQKSPLGPGQSDLFRLVQGAQGTLGIITWATIRLELLASRQKLLLVSGREVGEMIEFVAWLQRLKLGDECLILDRLNLAALLEEDAKTIQKLARELPPYILVLVVAGYDRFPEERVEYQTNDILDLARKYNLQLRTELPGVDPGKLLQLLSGPSPEPYWKLRPRGNCVDIFFLTTLQRAPGFIELMSRTARETGFPADCQGTYLQPVQQGRGLHLEFNLYFNPDNRDEIERARATFTQTSQALVEEGAFFSRPYGPWPELIRDRYAGSVSALIKIKDIFDPNRVLNPGKLFF